MRGGILTRRAEEIIEEIKPEVKLCAIGILSAFFSFARNLLLITNNSGYLSSAPTLFNFLYSKCILLNQALKYMTKN